MSVFTLQKTEQEMKLEEARSQADHRRGIIISFAYGLDLAYKNFWYSVTLSPQEQCDIQGDEAIDLFTKHANGVKFVLENMPNIEEYIPGFMDTTTIPKGYSISTDTGKVVITYTPPVVPEPVPEPVIEETPE